MTTFIIESTMVLPAEEMPKTKLWLSNLDLMSPNRHIKIVYFYKRLDDVDNFFDTKVMKDSLSRALVAFYPLGGRLYEDKTGRVEIDCQGQGALFVEAESDSVLDDLGDFSPRTELELLIPPVDYSLPIGSNPLLILQVTHFKCGGVCLGVGVNRHVADMSSTSHFMKTWSDMARGVDLAIPPFIDRTILRARDPPQPVFDNVEYQSPPPMKPLPLEAQSDEIMVSTFKLSRDQINVLEAKSKQNGSTISYTSFELLAGHVWKCVCKARGLEDDQETKLFISTDGRARLEPNLPAGFFGNCGLMTTAIAQVHELKSNPSKYASCKIHDTLLMTDNDYIRSTLDYLELQPNLKVVLRGVVQTSQYSNLGITSWVSLPSADFGWGRPIYMGPGGIYFNGLVTVLPCPINDVSLSIVIGLHAEYMKLFTKLFYDI